MVGGRLQQYHLLRYAIYNIMGILFEWVHFELLVNLNQTDKQTYTLLPIRILYK